MTNDEIRMKNQAPKPNDQAVIPLLTQIDDSSTGPENLDHDSVQGVLRANDQIARGQYLTSEQMRERLRREVFRK